MPGRIPTIFFNKTKFLYLCFSAFAQYVRGVGHDPSSFVSHFRRFWKYSPAFFEHLQVAIHQIRIRISKYILSFKKYLIQNQCCGSGSTCFWASRIWIHWSEVWILIRILLSSCKNSKKNLDSYYFVTLFDFLSLKNDINVASKSNKKKKLC